MGEVGSPLGAQILAPFQRRLKEVLLEEAPHGTGGTMADLQGAWTRAFGREGRLTCRLNFTTLFRVVVVVVVT